MVTARPPTYDEMIGRTAGMREFLGSLFEGTPVPFPIEGGQPRTRANYARRLATEMGFRVVVRKRLDGYWIVRLRPEDA